MHDAEFVQKRTDRLKIDETCYFIEKAAHKLLLMSRRQRGTVAELRGQISVLQKWLRDLDDQLAVPPSPQRDSAKQLHGWSSPRPAAGRC